MTTNNQYILLIGDGNNKYKSIKYKIDENDNKLYLLLPFDHKDLMKEYTRENNISYSFSSSEKAWVYPLNFKDEILEQAMIIFKEDPKMKDFINLPVNKAKTVSSKIKTQPLKIISPAKTKPQFTSIPNEFDKKNEDLKKNDFLQSMQPVIDVEPDGIINSDNNEHSIGKNPVQHNNYAIQPHKGAAISLPVEIDIILENWKKFRQLDSLLLDESDYQEVWTHDGPKKFKKKSAFRKYATAYGISCKIVGDPIIIYRDDKYKSFIFKVYMIAFPSNNPAYYQDGWGVCDALERCIYEEKKYKDKKTGEWKIKPKCEPDCDWRRHFTHFQHDIESTAHTRAKNRCISDLVAGGEVSYEEIQK